MKKKGGRVFSPDSRIFGSQFQKQLATARQKEDENRLKAHLPNGLYEPVLGTSCFQPTLNTYYLLKCTGSPFLDETKSISKEDCASVLWIHSKDFAFRMLPPKSFSESIYKNYSEHEILTKTYDFWFPNFWDSDLLRPQFEQKKNGLPFKEKETGLLLDSFIHLFAREYHWSKDDILNTQLRLLFLLSRRIKQSNIKDYKPYSYSDFVRESLLRDGIST